MTFSDIFRPIVSATVVLGLIASAPLAAQGEVPGLLQPQSKAGEPTLKPTVPAERPWLYEKSDVPIDPAWQFGVLDNGLRYAVRRNDVPAGQVSIRVRVDVGSLMEEPAEAGFAHFIEHLSFRGSRDVPDGESKRIWQRLGAEFGSDSNAQTTPTGTTYALDLPRATNEGIDESLRILAGMMQQPNISKAPVEAERAVILAERRESLGPGARLGDEIRAFYFAGQRLASHSPIGTEQTLLKATPQALRAFHDRWYRPDRTVIAISGSMEPAALEAMVHAHFSGWKAKGRATPLPDFGKPDPSAPATKVIVEPSVPYSVGLAYLRPWVFNEDTIVFNQMRLADMVALELINRRLEAVASDGASFVQANVSLDNSMRSANATYVTIVPNGSDWEKALQEVRAIIEDARRVAPSQVDIDREFQGMEAGFAALVASAAIEGSPQQVESIVQAVDIRETVVSPQDQLAIYQSSKKYMTPEQLLAATNRLFSATVERALLSLRAPQDNAEQRLQTAFSAQVEPNSRARLSDSRVTMAALPKLPAPGKVASRTDLGVLGIQNVTFENGVRLLVAGNQAEPGKVHINVRWGHGRQSFAPDERAALWAVPYALTASGIGDLGQRELNDLMSGRRLSLNFGIDDDAFTLSGTSSPQDYPDQLRLFASKLAFPRWDEAPLRRSMAMLEASYDPVPASAAEAIGRDLEWMLRDKDARFSPASPDDRTALTLDTFRKVWAPRLANGPIEIQVFGDLDVEQAIAAVAASFGALPKRADAPPPARNLALNFPAHVATPVRIVHDGPDEQAAAIIAWPTGSGVADIRESRQLEMLARIITDRLFERLRSIDGAAYTPSASSNWPERMNGGGFLVVQTQLKPERIPYFYQLVDELVRDLTTNPVTEDELNRQIAPVRQLLTRAAYSNAFWMDQLQGFSRDENQLGYARALGRDLTSITPADLQALAARYLVPEKSWSAVVLPESAPAPALGTSAGSASAPTR
ncbi:zinc protease [Sphingobium sp. B2D3A]|uniref:M16 family metallopeptidase n=1 Tax=unclassified Sphingobium TaxID=2611147 RepID=UPI0022255B65|nr:MULTISPECIES: M16 family metallopeptidase [unclassified Sphingobium]MCW2338449.1 zinc protease [Sphingobium sp. B2D3A]MCW2384907.1 zinc protease [Sphingobium sp. B2D3D]